MPNILMVLLFFFNNTIKVGKKGTKAEGKILKKEDIDEIIEYEIGK